MGLEEVGNNWLAREVQLTKIVIRIKSSFISLFENRVKKLAD
jgi:hypothetical protein